MDFLSLQEQQRVSPCPSSTHLEPPDRIRRWKDGVALGVPDMGKGPINLGAQFIYGHLVEGKSKESFLLLRLNRGTCGLMKRSHAQTIIPAEHVELMYR